MADPCGLEPQTSAVSKGSYLLLPITYRAPATTEVGDGVIKFSK